MSKRCNFWWKINLCTNRSHRYAKLNKIFLCLPCLYNIPINTKKCSKNQYGVTTKEGKVVCKLCNNTLPSCPASLGLSVTCGDVVPLGKHVHCVNCVLGETFSDVNDKLPCQKCKSQSCHENEEIIGICKVDEDKSSCSGKCKKGFYSGEGSSLADCRPCSTCLNNSSARIKKCINDGLPSEKQCEVGSPVVSSKEPPQPSKKNDKTDQHINYSGYKIYGHPAIFSSLLVVVFILLILLAVVTCRRKFRKKRQSSVTVQEETPLNPVSDQGSDGGVAETDSFDSNANFSVSSARKRKSSASSSGRKVSFSRQDSVNSNSNAGSEFDDERSVHSSVAVDDDELSKETDIFEEKTARQAPRERRRTLSSSSGKKNRVSFGRQVSNPEAEHKEEKSFYKRSKTFSNFTTLIPGQKLGTKEETTSLLLTDHEDSDSPLEIVALPDKPSSPKDEVLTMKVKDINGNIPSQRMALPAERSTSAGPSQLSGVKIGHLNVEIFRKVCVQLNTEIIGKNWRTLAGLMKYTVEAAKEFGLDKNPAEKLLEHWGARGDNDVAGLIKLLQDMERDDVIKLLESHPNAMSVLI